jgi:hypothetical protein
VNYSEDEENILRCIEERKTATKGQFMATWCIDYNEDRLKQYFSKEIELLEQNQSMEITRLINTEIGKAKVKSHLDLYKKYILNGRYTVYSTMHNEFELLICYDISTSGNRYEMEALQIYKGSASDRTPKLAVYSHDLSFGTAMRKLYEELMENGKKLDIRAGSQDFDQIAVDNWLQSYK